MRTHWRWEFRRGSKKSLSQTSCFSNNTQRCALAAWRWESGVSKGKRTKLTPKSGFPRNSMIFKSDKVKRRIKLRASLSVSRSTFFILFNQFRKAFCVFDVGRALLCHFGLAVCAWRRTGSLLHCMLLCWGVNLHRPWWWFLQPPPLCCQR
jgi:hypothetical protein